MVVPTDKILSFWAVAGEPPMGRRAKGEKRFHALGLRTIGQMAAWPAQSLVDHFGARGSIFGNWLTRCATGAPTMTTSKNASWARPSRCPILSLSGADRARTFSIFVKGVPMRVVYLVLLLIVLAAVVVFVTQNNETVTLQFLDRSIELRRTVALDRHCLPVGHG